MLSTGGQERRVRDRRGRRTHEKKEKLVSFSLRLPPAERAALLARAVEVNRAPSQFARLLLTPVLIPPKSPAGAVRSVPPFFREQLHTALDLLIDRGPGAILDEISRRLKDWAGKYGEKR
jgi:hypothetical protein